MEFKELIKERYSCKKYDGNQISSEQLQAILEAGRLAPTAKNLQEQHIYVMQSQDALRIIDEVTPCRYDAPTVLVVAFNAEDVYTYPGEQRDSGIEDASIVATHMLLAAKDTGVDSCWVNRFNPAELKEKMDLPQQEEILMLMDLGFAAEGAGPLANHESRKPLEDTVTYR